MALIQCDFFSNALGLSTSMNVILPQRPWEGKGLRKALQNRRYPVLYLLHGLSDDHTIWLRRTSIERYVEGKGLAVVMPAVARSFYTDMKAGLAYWTFVSQELPNLVASMFPVSTRREDCFAAGLSMGGYGALKLALALPERYAAAASLSGAVDIAALVSERPEMRREYRDIFGSAIRGTDNDLFHLARKLVLQKRRRPSLFMCCGTEDFLYQHNLRFKRHMEKLGYDFYFEDGPGTHEWGLWDRNIIQVLDWLPIRKSLR